MANIIFIDQDNNIQTQEIYLDIQNSDNKNPIFTIPDNSHKVTQLCEITKSITNGNIPILFDDAMSSSKEKGFEFIRKKASDYKSELQNAIAIIFTSGTSGNPIGVVKTIDNIIAETQIHIDWLKNYKFEQCLVTVPFFHIYGFLFGINIPLAMNLDIVTKEHFLPNEILNICMQKPTLCITNPVFIRAMTRINMSLNLKNTLFICSSGPLDSKEAIAFEQKYTTTLVQIYGSSETGGIAMRHHEEMMWSKLPNVEISIDEHDEILQVSSPFVSKYIYDGNFVSLAIPYKTNDIIKIVNDQFAIKGRRSELVKIGGKRLSVIEIEKILEAKKYIQEALVQTEHIPSQLRGELLHIFLTTDEKTIDKSHIKKSLHNYFGGTHIESKITIVKEIPKTALGKKIRIPMQINDKD